MIILYSGPAPGFVKYVNFTNGGAAMGSLQFATNSSTIVGHANALSAEAVGAARYDNTPRFGIDPPVVRSYSSAGPTHVRFDVLGNPSFSTRNKPDIVAPDGTNTTFFGSDFDGDGFPNFSGTSAAAPHAAAVAALLRDFDLNLTPAQIYSALESTAIDMNDPSTAGFDTGFDFGTGFGLVHAMGALMHARGAVAEENFLELNPFGDASLAGDLAGNIDIDTMGFFFDDVGNTTINVSEGTSPFDVGLALFGNTNFEQIDYNSGPTDQPQMTPATVSGVRYQAQVFNEIGVGTGSTDYTIDVNGPDQQVVALTPNANGDAAVSNDLSTLLDADYYSVVAPSDSNGNVTIDLTSVPIDGVLTLYDASGNQLARADAGAAGNPEQISFNSIVVDNTYYIRVGAFNGNSSGDYALNVNFETIAPVVDITFTSITTNNSASIFVNYNVVGPDAGPFDIGFYQSVDTLVGADTFVDSISVAAADRTEGSHTLTLALGTDVQLPGAGIADTTTEYQLLVVLDDSNAVAENDVDSFNEDNAGVFYGTYQVNGSSLMVFTTDVADTVKIDPSGSNVKLTINGVLISTYAGAGISDVRVRTNGGNDAIQANKNLAKPVVELGGPGNDTLNGGKLNDMIFGGEGNDKIVARLGDDSADGGMGIDSLAQDGTDSIDNVDLDLIAGAVVAARRNNSGVLQETDSFVAIETLTVGGLAGDDDINLSLLSLADLTDAGITKITVDGGTGGDLVHGSQRADTLKGGSGAFSDVIHGSGGNDTINGGDGNDDLFGDDGNDKLLGGNNDDDLDGGAGADTLDGGAGTDTGINGEKLSNIP
jgi:hypothetical protein